MSWIKENKFTAALAGVTLVGSVALITLASQKSGERDEFTTRLNKALKQEANLQGQAPYPNQSNLEAKKANVAAYTASAEKLQAEFAAYRPTAEEMADLAPTEFSKMVNGYRARLDEKFAAAETKIPQSAVYGFEAYASKLPRPEATGELHYQMSAFEWLFSTLAENSPESLINVHRPQLAIENDAPVVTEKKRRKSKSSKRGKASKSAPKGEPIYDKMPLELSFRCTEEQLRSFLEDIANSPKYFMAIRALRVQNERLTPPNDGDVKFGSQDEPAGDSGFSDFSEFDSGEEVEVAGDAAADVAENVSTVASDSDTTLALQQVLGAEKIYVFIKLDLLAFKPGEEAAMKGSN